MSRSNSIKICHERFNPAEVTYEDSNPIIFLHDLMWTKETWGEVPQRVASGTKRTVYSYDARNHGKTEYTDDSNFDHNLEDLFKFMDDMKIDVAVLVGHGMGGRTAINAALTQPKRVEKIFVVEMFVKRIPDELIDRAIKFMTLWMNTVRELNNETPIADVTKNSISKLFELLPSHMKWGPEEEAYLKGNFTYNKNSDGVYSVCYNAEALAKALKVLKKSHKNIEGKYCGPAYFIYGSKTRYNVQNDVDGIKQHFPRSTFTVIENATHFLISHFPDQFADILIFNIRYCQSF